MANQCPKRKQGNQKRNPTATIRQIADLRSQIQELETEHVLEARIESLKEEVKDF